MVRSSRDELGHKNHSPGHGWDLELGKLKNEKIIMKKVVYTKLKPFVCSQNDLGIPEYLISAQTNNSRDL